jgi:hypothetical protein
VISALRYRSTRVLGSLVLLLLGQLLLGLAAAQAEPSRDLTAFDAVVNEIRVRSTPDSGSCAPQRDEIANRLRPAFEASSELTFVSDEDAEAVFAQAIGQARPGYRPISDPKLLTETADRLIASAVLRIIVDASKIERSCVLSYSGTVELRLEPAKIQGSSEMVHFPRHAIREFAALAFGTPAVALGAAIDAIAADIRAFTTDWSASRIRYRG